jgi:hypothetical protein
MTLWMGIKILLTAGQALLNQMKKQREALLARIKNPHQQQPLNYISPGTQHW